MAIRKKSLTSKLRREHLDGYHLEEGDDACDLCGIGDDPTPEEEDAARTTRGAELLQLLRVARPPHQYEHFDEYVSEAEHGDGYGYWARNFATASEVVYDFDLYMDGAGYRKIDPFTSASFLEGLLPRLNSAEPSTASFYPEVQRRLAVARDGFARSVLERALSQYVSTLHDDPPDGPEGDREVRAAESLLADTIEGKLL